MRLTENQKASIINLILQAYPQVIVIYLFGSYATGHATKTSDIDLAILSPHEANLNSEMCWELAQKLTLEVGCAADVISLNSASTVFRYQIVSQGEVLYSVDELARQRFEMTVYSMYCRFNEERKPLLEEIKKRGRIY